MNLRGSRGPILLIGAIACFFVQGTGRAQGQSPAPRTGVIAVQQEGPAAATKCDTDKCINVGEKAAWRFYAYCYLAGKKVDDVATFNVHGVPPTRVGWDWTVKPNPNHTFKITTLTITTTEMARPDKVKIYLDATGPKCGYLPGFYLTLTVKPKIFEARDKNNATTTKVWWFNKAEPENYSTKITVKAKPATNAYGPFSWEIAGGKDFARFENRGLTMSTSDPSVKVMGFRSSSASSSTDAGKGAFNVTVTVNKVQSDPFNLKSLEPWKLQLIKSTDDLGKPGRGYETVLKFQLVDQYKTPLPETLPITEQFDNQGRCVWPSPTTPGCSANWGQGNNKEKTNPNGNPSNITDTIINICVPTLIDPDCSHKPTILNPKGCKGSLCTTPVFQWTGGVWAGGPEGNVKSGVHVEQQTWVLFQDHGRDCNIRSPLDAGPLNPDTCP